MLNCTFFNQLRSLFTLYFSREIIRNPCYRLLFLFYLLHFEKYVVKRRVNLPAGPSLFHKISQYCLFSRISDKKILISYFVFRFLLCGSTNGNAYIWQVNKPKEAPWLLKGHESEVTSVTWSPHQGDKVRHRFRFVKLIRNKRLKAWNRSYIDKALLLFSAMYC